MHIFQKAFLLCLTALSICLISCKKDVLTSTGNSDLLPTVTETLPETHHWYYFTRSGFELTDIPAVSPDYPLRPWTQAPRISGTLSGNETGYLLVNRRGLIQLNENSDPKLIPDARLFSGTTADTLITSEANPAFKLYVNTLFEEKVDNSTVATGQMPVIVQYNPETNLYYPLISKATLHLSETAQITSFIADGENWYFSAKEADDLQTTFSYLKMSSGTDFGAEYVETVSENEFRNLWSQQPYSGAPQRLRELLSIIPDDVAFTLTACDYSQSVRAKTPDVYYHGPDTAADDMEVLGAYGQTGKTWCLVVFSDGTCYFTGSLPKLHILNNGKPVYFRLPSLPVGIEYTDFALCGHKLYCGWEEVNFYNTGKAGFLEVDLERVLY